MSEHYPAKITEWLITENCNLRCKYCFEPWKNAKTLTFGEEHKKQIDTSNTLYLFGGEPLLNIKFIEDTINYIIETQPNNHELLHSARTIITNGTLIKRNLEKIKELQLMLQVSLDGPKTIHDSMRVYNSGRGSWDIIMEGIDLCIEHKIPVVVHGVITKANYSKLPEYFDFLCQIEKKLDPNNWVENMNKNNLMVSFEDALEDSDIKAFITAQETILEKIKTEYSDVAKPLMKSWYQKQGSPCTAGQALKAFANGKIYPCHRFKSTQEIGEHGKITNHNLLNGLYEQNAKTAMFGTGYNNFRFINSYWVNWCPAANLELTGSINALPYSYSLLVKAYNDWYIANIMLEI